MLNLRNLVATEFKDRIRKKRSLSRFEEYKYDPVRFVKEVLKEKIITEDQQRVLNACNVNSRVVVPSGNETGKTRCAAWVVLWWMYCNGPNTKAITTAPTGRQVRELLWREIRARHRISSLPGKCLTVKLDIGEDRFAIGFSTDEPQQFQGFHARNILLVVDEANGINDDYKDPLLSCVDGERTLVLLIGNPMVAEGWFYSAAEESELYTTIQISGENHPNVVQNENIIPGAITRQKIKEYEDEYGRESSIFCSRVKGEFPDEEETRGRLFLSKWVYRAQHDTRPERSSGYRVLSIDCAREGKDKTSILGIHYNDDGVGIQFLRRSYQQTSVVEIIGLAVVALSETEYSAVVIDEVGVGGGVVDGLRVRPDVRCHVYGFKGGEKPIKRPKVTPFRNKQIEAYWLTRNVLRNGELFLDDWDGWPRQLKHLRYSFSASGNLQLDNKRSEGYSPDEADSLSMNVWAYINATGLKRLKGRGFIPGRSLSLPAIGSSSADGGLSQFGLFDKIDIE